ncbi:hypothetical protein ACJ73_01558 [Blastomyces percursus]|uniref:C2H2-type domain-containing protein n=1 Tax=Blastomyces percursus TaxID=1658174 RepID=A0A1J9RGD4_9EURO|nr:hypothetical protein ACJ73_01558 [Blastomyces percursus]
MDPNPMPQALTPSFTIVPPQGPPSPSAIHHPMVQSHTLPPLQHPQLHYLGQPYRHDIPLHPIFSAGMYAASSAPTTTQVPAGSLPPSSFLAPPCDISQDYFNAPPLLPNAQPRTEIRGLQGRRGVLPSVLGRPAAVINNGNGTAKSMTLPAADGRFRCPYCDKTYLRVNGIKIHLREHTGERPYMCELCKSTFTRKDYLKRHFRKCSERLGDPMGVSHLIRLRAHRKGALPVAIAPKPVQEDVSSSISISNGMTRPRLAIAVNGAGRAPAHEPSPSWSSDARR